MCYFVQVREIIKVKEVIVAIDIGTTNVKCVVADREMRVIADCVSEYKTHSVGIARFEQDCEDWWTHTKIALSCALAKAGLSPSCVIGIAVSSQAPTMLPVDANGKAVHPALIWMDRRSDAQCAQMKDNIGADRVFEITGNTADPFYTYGELLWFKQECPEAFERTHCVLQCNGYVNLRLTGEFTIDRTHASITQCYDVTKGCWDEEMLRAFSVPAGILPRVVECDEIIGGVCEAAAKETGLRPGTPVLGGSVDGAAAALEGGVLKSGDAVEMSGTSSVLLVGTAEKHCSPNLTYMYGAIPGQHLLLGCMSTTGGALKWYRDELFAQGEGNAYERMNKIILADCPEPTPLVFLPYMAGERAPIWDTHAKGAFLGLTFDTREADMLRAIQEGAAFALMDNLTEAKMAGAKIDRLRAVGGSTNSDIWMQIKASVTGMPIEIPSQNLGAPGGLLALLASKLGDYASIEEACGAILKIERTVEPVERWIEWYKDQFEIFKAYYKGCKEVFRMSDKARQKKWN